MKILKVVLLIFGLIMTVILGLAMWNYSAPLIYSVRYEKLVVETLCKHVKPQHLSHACNR